jgi:hypothetical protein
MCDFTFFSFYNIALQIILSATQNLKSLSLGGPDGTGAFDILSTRALTIALSIHFAWLFLELVTNNKALASQVRVATQEL